MGASFGQARVRLNELLRPATTSSRLSLLSRKRRGMRGVHVPPYELVRSRPSPRKRPLSLGHSAFLGTRPGRVVQRARRRSMRATPVTRLRASGSMFDAPAEKQVKDATQGSQARCGAEQGAHLSPTVPLIKIEKRSSNPTAPIVPHRGPSFPACSMSKGRNRYLRY